MCLEVDLVCDAWGCAAVSACVGTVVGAGLEGVEVEEERSEGKAASSARLGATFE